MKEQFSGAISDDAAAHHNNFVELCKMQKYKDVDGNIIKLKLFPFSLRGRATTRGSPLQQHIAYNPLNMCCKNLS
jgi:hypothetical protein